MTYLWPIIAVALSFLLSFGIRSLSLKKKIALTEPRSRDLHSEPTPRLGGLAVVLSFLITILLLAFLAPKNLSDFGFPFAIFGISIDKRLLGIILAIVFLSVIMLKDDLKGVKAYWKLVAQIVAASILVAAGVGITYLNNPFGLVINLDTVKFSIKIGADVYHFVLWADLFLILWVVLLTNATNFIDGLDGLASSLSFIAGLIIVFLSLIWHQNTTALLSLIFIGSILGFLVFNLPKALMFLGDTGSNFLGLMLAVLTVISGGKLATVLLVFGLVIIDALYVVVKRIIRGKNPFTTADQTHLHHRFLKAGFSPIATLITILLISLAFGAVGLFLSGKVKILMIAVLALLSIVLFVLLDARRKRVKNKLT